MPARFSPRTLAGLALADGEKALVGAANPTPERMLVVVAVARMLD